MPKYVIEREIPGREIVDSRTQRHCAEIMRRAEQDGAADSMGQELRGRRQNLLRIHRPE